jgi:hypothetical protein
VYWLTEPMREGSADDGFFLLQNLHTMAMLHTTPHCQGGSVGFSLDPSDPLDVLGPYFRKSFYPAGCGDLWSDLLMAQVLLEADYDLKRLLHNLDGVMDNQVRKEYDDLNCTCFR